MVGYPLLLLSDKISTSQLLHLLTPQLLAPESNHVIDKSSKAMTTPNCRTLKQINTPAQCGVICKLTEGAFNALIQIIDEDIKQDCPKTGPWGAPLVTSRQLDLTPFTITLYAWPSSQLFLPSEVYTHAHHEQPVSPGGCCGEQC